VRGIKGEDRDTSKHAGKEATNTGQIFGDRQEKKEETPKHGHITRDSQSGRGVFQKRKAFHVKKGGKVTIKELRGGSGYGRAPLFGAGKTELTGNSLSLEKTGNDGLKVGETRTNIEGRKSYDRMGVCTCNKIIKPKAGWHSPYNGLVAHNEQRE